MRYCLDFNKKIRNRQVFDQVFKKGKRLYGRHFLAYYRRNELPYARIGIISSKRNVRKAVDRNRIRRIIKEQFRLNQLDLPNMDIVFISKKGIGEVENKELHQCVIKLLQKIKTLSKNC
jgi:ribonuclease P protein component